MSLANTALPPVSDLLAHRPPLRLVDEVIEARERGVTCKTVIGPDFVFLRDGLAECAVCIELVAQAVGCCVGLADRKEGGAPRKGLLVGTRDARLAAEPLRIGDTLVTKVEQKWVREQAASFVGEVTRDGTILAEVEILVVSGIDPASLMNGSADA